MRKTRRKMAVSLFRFLTRSVKNQSLNQFLVDNLSLGWISITQVTTRWRPSTAIYDDIHLLKTEHTQK